MLTLGEHIALDAAAMEERADGLRYIPFILTAPGVHRYQIGGKTVRVLKDGADFFSPSYLESARSAPITDEHPTQAVTPSTPQAVVGMASDSAAVADGDKVRHGGVLFHQDAISKVASKRIRAVSAGFHTRLEELSGTWTDSTGVSHEFDAVQRDPRINHIALTASPRVPEARILLDSQTAIWMPEERNAMDELKALLEQIAQDSALGKSAGDALREALDSRDGQISKLTEELAEARGKVQALEVQLQNAPTTDSLRESFKAQIELAALIAKASKLELDALVKLETTADMYRAGLAELGVEMSQDACEAELRGAWNVASNPKTNPNSVRATLMTGDSGHKSEAQRIADIHARDIARSRGEKV